MVDDYAAQGYLALAPATFQRVKPGVELGYTPDDVAAGVALKALVEAHLATCVLQDIQAAIDYAAVNATGKVGLVGYSWGGLLAWRAACQLSKITSAVAYYGGGMTSAAEIARIPKCPVQAHFAKQDQSTPLEGIAAFRQAHPDVELHLYDASHGFNCDQRAAYNAPAAALARTLAFFAQTAMQTSLHP